MFRCSIAIGSLPMAYTVADWGGWIQILPREMETAGKNAGRFFFQGAFRAVPAGAGTCLSCTDLCLRVGRGFSTARTRRAGPVGCPYDLARTFYASTRPLSTLTAGLTAGIRIRARPVRGGVATTNSRDAKELSEGEMSDQRAAAHTRC